MDLTIKDLELLVNDQNKILYSSMYDLILGQFEDGLKYTDTANLNEERQKVIGTCGIYLSSLVELLHTLRDLMEKGYIESGAAVATACWERALTLRKIMIDPVLNSQIHTDHQKAKKTPWSVLSMVGDVVENERKISNISDGNPFDEKDFYLQYTFLSGIKHGNPYAISHLYRPDYSSDEKLFRLKTNDSFEDRDLKSYIKILVANNALDALIDYSKEFRTNYNILEEIKEQMNRMISHIELQPPSIMLVTPEEMGRDYWDHLIEIGKKRKF